MKLNRTWAMVAAIVMALTLSLGSTLAYLSDTDSDVNVMTLGNVKIDQIELERGEDNKLQKYTNGQALYPAVYEDVYIWGQYGDPYKWSDNDDENLIDGIPTDAWNQLWNDSMVNNIQDKMVFVKNTGKSNAFYRTIFAFESPSDDRRNEIGQSMIHLNFNGNILFDMNPFKDRVQNFGDSDDHDIFWLNDVEIDNVLYNIMVVTYQAELKPGEVSRPSLLQIGLDREADNAYVEQFGNSYDALVLSQAMQSAGFDSADKALNTGFGEVTEDNVKKWFEDEISINTPSSDDELDNALNSDKKNIVISMDKDMTYDTAAWANEAMGGADTETVTIYGNGHTLTFKNTNKDWNNVVTNGAKLILNDVVLTNDGYGATSGTWNHHDINFNCEVELNNVTSLNALSFAKDATVNNLTITDDSTSDAYLLWIRANGQTVNINGLNLDATGTDGDDRGIKISDQYIGVDDRKLVTLKVSNATFKTETKAAILVGSTAGADITLSNINIEGVSNDASNAVWVDSGEQPETKEDYRDSFDCVTVHGGTKIVEP